jgi:O-methyltransferase
MKHGQKYEAMHDAGRPGPVRGGARHGGRAPPGPFMACTDRPGVESTDGLKTRPSKCGWWPADGFGYNSGNFRSIKWLSWGSQSARATAVAYGQQTGTKYANKVRLGLSRPVTCYDLYRIFTHLTVTRGSTKAPWPSCAARTSRTRSDRGDDAEHSRFLLHRARAPALAPPLTRPHDLRDVADARYRRPVSEVAEDGDLITRQVQFGIAHRVSMVQSAAMERGQDDEPLLAGFGNDSTPIGRFDVSDPAYADFSADEIETIETVWSETVTSPERIVALIRAVRHLVRCDIAGDIVECGVWRGGSMMAVARTLLAQGSSGRELWLYDTFAGMTAPGEHDVDFDGTPAGAEFSRRRITDDSSSWASASLETVRSNLLSTGYPESLVHLVPGRVEKTIPRSSPPTIALLRLDTDWYASTRHELEHLYPRLVQGGVLIIDDYGHWQGARRATEEYLDRVAQRPLLQRIDYSGRIAVKP